MKLSGHNWIGPAGRQELCGKPLAFREAAEPLKDFIVFLFFGRWAGKAEPFRKAGGEAAISCLRYLLVAGLYPDFAPRFKASIPSSILISGVVL